MYLKAISCRIEWSLFHAGSYHQAHAAHKATISLSSTELRLIISASGLTISGVFEYCYSPSCVANPFGFTQGLLPV